MGIKGIVKKKNLLRLMRVYKEGTHKEGRGEGFLKAGVQPLLGKVWVRPMEGREIL